MMKTPFKKNIKYTLRHMEVRNADPTEPPQRFAIDLHDKIHVEEVTENGIQFAVTRILTSSIEGMFNLVVEFLAFLDFSDVDAHTSDHNDMYWEKYLYEHPENTRVLFGFASSIISNVLMTYGSRHPVITPPLLVCDDEKVETL